MKSDFAQTLLRKVRADYQMLADQYSSTREDIWPEYLEFQKYLQPGMKVLDIGCGNGRLTKIFDKVKVDYTGVDVSPRMLEQARKLFPGYKFQVGDIMNLPFSEGEFDAVFCLQVIHQIPSGELRRQALGQMSRVLKPGGRIIVAVWNLWRPIYRSKLNRNNLKKFFGLTPYDKNDILIPWRDSGVEQYYHAFTQPELKRLLSQAGLRVEREFLGKEYKTDSKYHFNNIVIIAQKAG
ncbi:MAG: class I SAM-dependent methyltransferase [Patescibacteria group bacterium]|nr:class I SAM-dependent methyltransferase [Patescibacteria group bacterium]